MATITEKPENAGPVTPSHTYHAEAHALSGKLQRPVEQEIEHQAKLALNDMKGGHFTRVVEDVSVQGLVVFARAHTRISGSRSLKHNGWVTVSTSVLEALNIFEVITADRLVSQVSTDHAYENGHIPQVTFLGTHFDNFRVSGFPVKLEIDLAVCGRRPEDSKSYLEDLNFLRKVREQNQQIAKASGLPKELKAQYDERLAGIDALISVAGNGKSSIKEPKVICSLVKSIGEIPIPGVKSFGHVLVIPEFGTLALGEVVVGERMYKGSTRPSAYFELTNTNMNLGCVGDGAVQGAVVLSNGHHNP
jgi:hypothetical protein